MKHYLVAAKLLIGGCSWLLPPQHASPQPPPPRTDAARARELAEDGRRLLPHDDELANAELKFAAAVGLDPLAEYHFDLCQVRYRRGRLEAARDACRQVDPRTDDAGLERKAAALLADIDRRLRRSDDPTMPPDDRAARARVLDEQGKDLWLKKQDLAGAEGKFAEAVALDPRATYFFNLCYVRHQLGRFEAARDSCREVTARAEDEKLKQKAAVVLNDIDKRLGPDGPTPPKATELPASATLGANPPVFGLRCALEGERCVFRGPQEVWFGVPGGKLVHSRHVDGVACDTGVFGDPSVGIRKGCYIGFQVQQGSCRGPGWLGGGWPKRGASSLDVVGCADACRNAAGCTAFDISPAGDGRVECFLFGHADVRGEDNPSDRCYVGAGGAGGRSEVVVGGPGVAQRFVWAPKPVSARYEPPKAYVSAPEGPVEIARTSVGRYAVAFDGMAGRARGGNVQVVAYGLATGSCKPVGWVPSASALRVDVACFDAAGNPTDAQFSLLASFAEGAAAPGGVQRAWVWASESGAEYDASAAYAHNPAGGRPRIRRRDVGEYAVRFPGLGADTRHVNAQVSAYGASPERCVVRSAGEERGDLEVVVGCLDPAGRPANARFSLLLTVAPRGAREPEVAFTRYPGESAVDSRPDTLNSAGGQTGIDRRAQGHYEVTFKGMSGKDGNVQVSGYGASNAWCNVEEWVFEGADSVVRVRCYQDGAPRDSGFSLLYTRPAHARAPDAPAPVVEGPGLPPGNRLRRSTTPVRCGGDDALTITGVHLDAASDALIIEGRCRVVLRNSRIETGGRGIVIRDDGQLVVQSSEISSGGVAVAMSGRAALIAKKTRFRGQLGRHDESRYQDEGGNAWSR